MSNVHKGQKYRFYFWDSSLATPAYNKVGETREKTLNRSKNLLGRSTDDQSQDASYIGGLREGEVTISGLWAPSDVGQTMIKDIFEDDLPTKMKLEGEEAGDIKVVFDGHIEDWTRTNTLNELSEFELTIRTDGPITETVLS